MRPLALLSLHWREKSQFSFPSDSGWRRTQLLGLTPGLCPQLALAGSFKASPPLPGIRSLPASSPCLGRRSSSTDPSSRLLAGDFLSLLRTRTLLSEPPAPRPAPPRGSPQPGPGVPARAAPPGAPFFALPSSPQGSPGAAALDCAVPSVGGGAQVSSGTQSEKGSLSPTPFSAPSSALCLAHLLSV